MSFVFRGGLPYELDKKNLRKAYPVEKLVEGLVIEHEQLEGILGYNRNDSRYRGVVDSWIGDLRRGDAIIVASVRSRGYEVLDPSGILVRSRKKIDGKLRGACKSFRLLAYVDRARLSQAEQATYDRISLVVARLGHAISVDKKEITTNIPSTKSLPKPKLVQQDEAKAS